jgi:hypothetical protein
VEWLGVEFGQRDADIGIGGFQNAVPYLFDLAGRVDEGAPRITLPSQLVARGETGGFRKGPAKPKIRNAGGEDRQRYQRFHPPEAYFAIDRKCANE